MRKLILGVIALAAASAAATQLASFPKPGLSPRGVCVRPPRRFSIRKRPSSPGEAGVSAGTMPDGEAPDGTGAALIDGAAWAGVV